MIDDPTNDNPNPNVVPFEDPPDLDSPASEVLLLAVSERLVEVVVLGRYPTGELFIEHTFENPADANFLLDQAKLDLLLS